MSEKIEINPVILTLTISRGGMRPDSSSYNLAYGRLCIVKGRQKF